MNTLLTIRLQALRALPLVVLGVLAFSSAPQAHAMVAPEQLTQIQNQLQIIGSQLHYMSANATAGEVLGASTTTVPSRLDALLAKLAEQQARLANLQTQSREIAYRIASTTNQIAETNAAISRLQNGTSSASTTKGIQVYRGTNSAVLTPAAMTGQHDYVTYTLGFDVVAVNQDVYIAKNADKSIVYSVVNGTGVYTNPASTTVVSFTSNVTNNSGYFFIPKGTMQTFSLVAKWTPGHASTAHALELDYIKYSATPTGKLKIWSPSSFRDFRAMAVSTNN